MASVNGYLLSVIESKELAKVSSSYGEEGTKEEKTETLTARSGALFATANPSVGGSVNRTVGQARRLPIHPMASGSACPTNPLSEVSYLFGKQEATARSKGSFFDGAVDVSQMIAKRVTGVGCSLLQVTGEIQLCAQGASSLDGFCLLPFPLPNGPGSRK